MGSPRHPCGGGFPLSGSDGSDRPHEEVLAVVEESGLPGIVLDPEERTVLAVNATFDDEYSWEADEIVGRHIEEIVADDDVEAARDFVSVLSFGGTPDPTIVRPEGGSGEAARTKWRGIPNMGGDRGRSVPVICRPMPGTEGRSPEDPEHTPADRDPVSGESRGDLDVQKDTEDHSRSFWG